MSKAEKEQAFWKGLNLVQPNAEQNNSCIDAIAFSLRQGYPIAYQYKTATGHYFYCSSSQ